MLMAFGLVAAGFGLGVTLTALGACYVYGLLHAEVVRHVESYGAVYLFTFGSRRDDLSSQGCKA